MLAPLAQSVAVTSSMFIHQIHRYNTPLNSDGHLKNAVASVSSPVQVYLHLNVVHNVSVYVFWITVLIRCVHAYLCVCR